MVATLERSCPKQVQLPEVLVFFSQVTVLDIVVHAMGRQSGGCEWDFKGLVYPNIQLNGDPLKCSPIIAAARPHPAALLYLRHVALLFPGCSDFEPASKQRVRCL